MHSRMILVLFVKLSYFTTLSWQRWLVSTFKFWQFSISWVVSVTVQLWKAQDWRCLRRRLGHRPRPRRRGWIYQSWLPYSDWPKPRTSCVLQSNFVWSNEKWPYKRTDLIKPLPILHLRVSLGTTWDYFLPLYVAIHFEVQWYVPNFEILPEPGRNDWWVHWSGVLSAISSPFRSLASLLNRTPTNNSPKTPKTPKTTVGRERLKI